jgi:hypothetical protein
MCQVTSGNNLSIDVENNSPFLTVWASSYVDGDVGVLWKFIYMMLVDIHLRIADRRHPHVFSVVSATKVLIIFYISKDFAINYHHLNNLCHQ